MKAIWIVCAIACSVPQDVPSLPRDIEEPPPPESEPTALPAPGLDPASVCGRAEVCCRAFASATPHVVEQSACAGPAEAAAEPDAAARCRRMLAGWRTALERREGNEVPPECSAPGE